MIDMEFYDIRKEAEILDDNGNPVSFRGIPPRIGDTIRFSHPLNDKASEWIVTGIDHYFYRTSNEDFQLATVSVVRST